MTQQAKFERRLRAAKSEHDEARHYVKNYSRRVREEAHRERNRALRHISKAIVTNEVAEYAYAVAWMDWPVFEEDSGHDWDQSELPARRWSA